MFHIPQCSIQNRNGYISILNGALWDMEQVHSGICEIDLYKMADILLTIFRKKKFLITNIVYHLRLSVKKWLDIEYAHLCRWKSQHPSGFKKQTYIWFHLTLGIVIEIGRTQTPKPFTVLICAYWFVMLYFVIKFCICHILYLNIILCVIVYIIMTSSNRNFFCVTGPLCGEFVGHRWIPLTKASDAELWCFLWSAPQETIEQTIETLVIWDTIVLILTSL